MNNKYSMAEQLTWPENWEDKRASEAKYFVQRIVEPIVWFGFCVGVVSVPSAMWLIGV